MKPPVDPATHAERVEIYKLLVEMADRVNQRRQNANAFFLSVNTLLIGASAFAAKAGVQLANSLVIAVAGIAITALWLRSIGSYASLNDAKFAVINELENKLSFRAFTQEWAKLHAPIGEGTGDRKKKHRPFHQIEARIPWVFMFLYLIQGARIVPWSRVFEWYGSS